MKVNFAHKFVYITGKPVLDQDGKEVTLATVAANSLLMENQQPQTGEYKLQLWKLAQKIYGSDEIDLSPEEIVIIKNEIARTQGPLVSGQCWELLA